jgi:hypothetical protein
MARQQLVDRINAQWEATGPTWDIAHSDKILDELYKLLHHNENILAWLDGTWGYREILVTGRRNSESDGVVVATDKRLIFCGAGWMTRLLGIHTDELRYANIHTVKPEDRGWLSRPAIKFVLKDGEDYWIYQNKHDITEDAYREARRSFIAGMRSRSRARIPREAVVDKEEVIEKMARGFSLVNRPNEGARKLLSEALEDGEELELTKRVDYSIDALGEDEREGHVVVTDRRVIMFAKGADPRNDDVTALRFSDVDEIDHDTVNRPSDVIIRCKNSPAYKLSCMTWDRPKGLIDSIRAHVASGEIGVEHSPSNLESNESTNVVLESNESTNVVEDISEWAWDEPAGLLERRKETNRQWDRIAPEWWDGPDYRDLRQVLPDILEDDENIVCVVGGECGSPVKKCVVLSTDRRVLYLPRDDSGSVFDEIFLSRITSVTRKRGLWKSRVKIVGIDGFMAEIKLSHVEAKMILSWSDENLGSVPPADSSKWADDVLTKSAAAEAQEFAELEEFDWNKRS